MFLLPVKLNSLPVQSPLRPEVENSLKAIQWADVDLILKVLLPVEMPNFDSLKSNSITTDLVGLLKKILRLAPDAAYDSQCIKTDQLVKFLEFPARREEIGSDWLDEETNESTVSDMHYLMGDYFMKNGDRIRIGFS